MDLDWAQKLALNSFYPVVRARILANPAAAVHAFREAAAMVARVGGFSPAELASDDELRAELMRRPMPGTPGNAPAPPAIPQ